MILICGIKIRKRYGPVTGLVRDFSSSSGFTLVELIVSLVIMGMITVLVSEGFRLGTNAWDKSEAEAVEIQRLRILSGLMSQQLKSAYPYKMLIDSEEVVVFQGTSDSLLFATLSKDRLLGGFKWVLYRYTEGSLLYNEGILPDKELLEAITGKEEEIDSNTGEVTFEYLMSDEDGWSEEWEFGEDLPEAVRVKVGYFQPFLINLPMSILNVEDSQEPEDSQETGYSHESGYLQDEAH